MKITRWITAGVVAAAVGAGAPVVFAEDIRLEDAPQPVRTTVEREVGSGRLHQIERDVENGRTVYEVEFFDANDVKIELDIAEDGQLLSRTPD